MTVRLVESNGHSDESVQESVSPDELLGRETHYALVCAMEEGGDDSGVGESMAQGKVSAVTGVDDGPGVEDMDVDDVFSDISDVASQFEDDANCIRCRIFWDETFRKMIDVYAFFSDVSKFEAAIATLGRTANYEELSQKKRFRLKKILTKIRRGKSPCLMNRIKMSTSPKLSSFLYSVFPIC